MYYTRENEKSFPYLWRNPCLIHCWTLQAPIPSSQSLFYNIHLYELNLSQEGFGCNGIIEELIDVRDRMTISQMFFFNLNSPRWGGGGNVPSR